MQKASIRDKIQDLYKKGTALGIFWGLGFAIFDLLMKMSPFAQPYINFLTTVTVPLYEQLTAFTNNSPLLVWLYNSVMTIIYLLLGYGVKITSSAVFSFWTTYLRKLFSR